ncbi:MAG: HAD-IB family hydrolase [Actinomycetota bacterium]|nr:HAD-IB family hydrolase [Actinomycetota bacterium]
MSEPSAGREAAFFDLDKTVIAKAAMAAFRGPLRAGGLLDRRGLLRAGLAQLVYLHLGASENRVERIRDAVLRLTRGWSRDQVSAIVEETLELVVEPIIYAEALELIEQHHDEGRLVVIVSASPEELVVPLGRHLGVDETIASQAALDEAGRYTGEMAFYSYGPLKVEGMRALAQRRGIDLARSYAYSDSVSDLPMLEAVGHPVVVNADRLLARVARERNWEARTFARPVPVRLGGRWREAVAAQAAQRQREMAAGAVAVSVVAVVAWGRRARRAS